MLEQFEKCLKRVNFYLKFLGLSLDRYENKSILQVIRSHWIYFTHMFTFNLELVAQILYLINAYKVAEGIVDITRLLPCMILCCISNMKSLTILFYNHYNNEFIDIMKKLLLDQIQIEEEENMYRKKIIDKHVSVLTGILKKIIYVIVMGILMFMFQPLFIIVPHYYKTNEVKLELPFLAYYPFNEYHVWIYPWVYFHQALTAILAVLMVYGPDCFFLSCCTFIQIQFSFLVYDMERLIKDDAKDYDEVAFKKLALRHIELIWCIDLLENIFSKSILFNASTSSMIICATGFNVMVVDNVIIMASFSAFLVFGLMQIFLYCYYGDIIVTSSMEVADAVYNSLWFNVKVAQRKGLLIVLTRAQKPCRLTANGFFSINLHAFASILSTSWSYFCLLQTMYQ